MAKKTDSMQPGFRVVRYDQLERFVRAFAEGHLNLLIVLGQPGLAKSQTVRRVVPDACWIEGNATAFGVGDSFFVTAGGRFVNLWHLASGRLERFGGARMAIVDLAIDPEEKRLAALGAGGSIKLWNLEAPTDPAEIENWVKSSTEMRIDATQSSVAGPTNQATPTP